MLYLGVDVHKHRSYVTVMENDGQVRFRGALSNTKEEFKDLITKLKEKCVAVVETTYCWGIVYDLLQNLGVTVKLAHAQKLRAIAECRIKNDVRDSEMLAHLLRTNLIPEVYVPEADIRRKKCVLRERQFLVKVQTSVKNRAHQLLDRNHINTRGYSDIFGTRGRKYLRTVGLPSSEKKLLESQLELLDDIKRNIKNTERLSGKETKGNRYIDLIRTMPGFGPVLSKVVALEIVDINRFPNGNRLASYAGLVPSEYASNKMIHRGPIIRQSNRHLKTAFIEAAWSALNGSTYFKSIYLNVRYRRGSNKAIVAVARKMIKIIYKMLKQNREYKEKIYMNKYNGRSVSPLAKR